VTLQPALDHPLLDRRPLPEYEHVQEMEDDAPPDEWPDEPKRPRYADFPYSSAPVVPASAVVAGEAPLPPSIYALDFLGMSGEASDPRRETSDRIRERRAVEPAAVLRPSCRYEDSCTLFSDGDNDLTSGMALLDVAERLRDLAQGVAPVDNWPDGARLYQLGKAANGTRPACALLSKSGDPGQRGEPGGQREHHMPGCVRDHGRFEAAASGEPAEDDPTRCVQRNRAHHERCGERKLRRYGAEVSEAEEHGGREFPPGVLSTSREPALLFKRLATLRQDAPVFRNLDELSWRGAGENFTAWAERHPGGGKLLESCAGSRCSHCRTYKMPRGGRLAKSFATASQRWQVACTAADDQ
jgi:hypothetical protein